MSISFADWFTPNDTKSVLQVFDSAFHADLVCLLTLINNYSSKLNFVGWELEKCKSDREQKAELGIYGKSVSMVFFCKMPVFCTTHLNIPSGVKHFKNCVEFNGDSVCSLLNFFCQMWYVLFDLPKVLMLPYCIQMWCLQRNVTLHHSTKLLFMPLPNHCQKRLARNVWFYLENEHSFPSGLARHPRTALHKAADFCGCFGPYGWGHVNEMTLLMGRNCCIFTIFLPCIFCLLSYWNLLRQLLTNHHLYNLR